MSRILYIFAANYDRKHFENSKIGLENSGFFSYNRVRTLYVYAIESKRPLPK